MLHIITVHLDDFEQDELCDSLEQMICYDTVPVQAPVQVPVQVPARVVSRQSNRHRDHDAPIAQSVRSDAYGVRTSDQQHNEEASASARHPSAPNVDQMTVMFNNMAGMMSQMQERMNTMEGRVSETVQG